MQQMRSEVTNWNNTHKTGQCLVVRPATMADVCEVVRNRNEYPAPVRAFGSGHSLNHCLGEGGTVVVLNSKADIEAETSTPLRLLSLIAGRLLSRQGQEGELDRIDAPNDNTGTITVGAGVTMIEIRNRLREGDPDRAPRYEIEVMPEIGNATAGSVACCGTKDSSLGRGPGQISSTVVAVKMVDAAGDLLSISENSRPKGISLPDVRNSYGMLGIVVEVTFKLVEARLLQYNYRVFDLHPPPGHEEMIVRTDGQRADGFLAFLQPFAGKVVVEQRTVVPGRERRSGLSREARGQAWENLATVTAELIGDNAPNTFDSTLRKSILQFDSFTAFRSDSMINFGEFAPSEVLDPARDNGILGRLIGRFSDALEDIALPKLRLAYFDFTFWAIPQDRWNEALPEILRFLRQHERDTGFRPTMPAEVYSIQRDSSSPLSFSDDGPILTFDLVHSDPSDPEWIRLNEAFNDFLTAKQWGARPLLNQTKEVRRHHVQEALGNAWSHLVDKARSLDTDGRLQSSFLAGLM